MDNKELTKKWIDYSAEDKKKCLERWTLKEEVPAALQDIKTAPKDGTHILGYGTQGVYYGDFVVRFEVISWTPGKYCHWYRLNGQQSYPVAWMPLPDTKGFEIKE